MEKWKAVIFVVTLATCFTLTLAAKSRFSTGMRSPDANPETVPLKLGRWTGEITGVSEEIDLVLGADCHVDRIYTNAEDIRVGLHIASFTDPVFRGAAPHHPQVCYPAAGWEILERRAVPFQSGSQLINAEVILYQKRSSRIATIHWYQSGDRVFTESSGVSLKDAFSGPSSDGIMKVLLQLYANSIDEAVETGGDFVGEIVEWQFASASGE
ncbi:MAG: exosortase C-terminal domain/associated protein EpsI [Planctomycetota bacterium]